MRECAMNRATEVQAARSTTLAISGMTCSGCARTVERVLSRVPGVERAKVDFDLGLTVVSGIVKPVELLAAVQAAGYGAPES